MLQITETETGYAFSGDTYNFRDLIKALSGAKWVPAEKVWTAESGADLTAIKARMAEHEASSKAWASAAVKKPLVAYGRCCEKAVIKSEYEQGPIFFSCECHGKRATTSRGFGYCGD